MQRAEDDSLISDDSTQGGDDDDAQALAAKGDAKDTNDVELHKLSSNGTEEKSSLLVPDSTQGNEESKRVKCDMSTLKLLLIRGGLYVIAIGVLIVGGVLSTFHPSVDLSEYDENCSVTTAI